MGSVNDGDVKFKDLAQAMYQFFGIKAKDCYRFYTDIRRRKNYSRTYFLDRMQEKLNDKSKRIRDASRYTSKKISLKFLFLSDIFLFPFVRQQFPVLA